MRANALVSLFIPEFASSIPLFSSEITLFFSPAREKLPLKKKEEEEWRGEKGFFGVNSYRFLFFHPFGTSLRLWEKKKIENNVYRRKSTYEAPGVNLSTT